MNKRKASMSIRTSEEVISQKIFLIRGQRVMLDYDLAVLYGVETRVLKQQVKRNIHRFPKDFMFILNKKEIDLLVSQFVIPSKSYLGGALPMAFTEQGIAMLSSILNSEQAIAVNIQIIRLFVKMRQLILAHKQILNKIVAMENRLSNHDEEIIRIFEYIKSLLEPAIKNRKPIGFKIPSTKK